LSTRLAIKVTPRAAAEIRRASSWWQANRPAAPAAFAEDLARAFEILAMQPGIGARAVNTGKEHVRRLLLSRTGYHLYYNVNPAERRVELLALWHSRRGQEPPL
jgi:plasmid stabilization system protein ParE